MKPFLRNTAIFAVFCFLLCISASAQNFPTSLDTSSSFPLFDEVRTTYLGATITSGSTTATVGNISLWSTGPYIGQIGNEWVLVTKTGTTTVTLTRGQYGSTAVSHLSGSRLYVVWTGNYWNSVRLGLINAETKLGYGSATPSSGKLLCSLGAGTSTWATPAACGIAGSGDLLSTNNLSDLANATTARTNLGLGNVQNTALSTWAGSTNLTTLGTIGTGTWQGTIIGPTFLGTGASISTKFLRGDGTWQALAASGDMLAANNLSDLVSASTARTNLGLGSLATQSGTFSGTSSGTNTGDQTITLTSDVTGSGTGSFATTIATSAVTLAKMADVATGSVFYRKTAGTGAPEVQTLATLKTDLGLTGTNSGDQTTVSGNAGTATALAADPADCASNRFANAINASGTLSCAQVDVSTSAVTGIMAAGNGGTGNAFTAFSGPAASIKTFTLPNATETIATLGQTQTFSGAQSFDKFYVSEVSPAQITADQNDYNPSGLTNWRINSDATRNITGIGGPSTGRIVKLTNSGSFNIVLNNQNTGSSAVNRIATATGSDITLLPNQSVSLFYDNTTQRWRDTATQSGILPAVNFPALTGDVTTSAGALGTTIGTNKVTTTTINANAVTLAKMDASNATANKMLLSGASASPTWSTSTIPTSAGATANKVLLSDGTNYALSTPTFPNASATSGKTIRSDGTNWIASTATLSDAPSTALKWLRSDGTNWITSTSTLSDTPSTAGKVLVSDGTNWITSTPTFPNASATSGKYIKSDGTNWIASTGSASGVGTCTNQVATVLNSDAAPTCASITNAMLGSTSYSQGTFYATCSGTATSSSTLFLFPIGQNSAFTCTITTATSGIPMPAAGHLKNLFFVAGSAGKAGDAVTILKNASATGMPTCVYGAATTCSDTSTSGTVAAGDLITVKIVTTTTDTTANVHISFQLWN